MVGSLMYLTASRPDLVFAVCMCARYQAKPTKKHLEAIKRIFRYERSHKGVKASANSDIIFFFTSAQDGNKLLDDKRLSLADDLKKAHDQNQNKSK
ncbi:hypothetical protein Tco_0652574 [Tanacetum coccineum]|uniref:Uncharacterized protein n=1 Tax=Tanacetum coccineum TaxID=301880 RepID=A0ABQ4WYP0_9ASTR